MSGIPASVVKGSLVEYSLHNHFSYQHGDEITGIKMKLGRWLITFHPYPGGIFGEKIESDRNYAFQALSRS
jgi:hypothetical protein